MSNYTKIEKPIQLMKKINTNKDMVECPICGGIGWLNDNDKWIVKCENCTNGYVNVCKYCGSPMGLSHYSWTCSNPECNYKELEAKRWKDELALKEEEKYSKATHYMIDTVPKESSEWYCSDSYEYNDGFFNDITELYEYCDDNNVEVPKYVWCTRKIPFVLNAYDIVDRNLEDSYEDARDQVDNKEIDKLQVACDSFVKAHGTRLDSYDIDYTKCLILNGD